MSMSEAIRDSPAVTRMRLGSSGHHQRTRSGAETESHAPSPGKSSGELVESSLQGGTCNGEESWGRCHRSPRTPARRSRLHAPAHCDSELPKHKRPVVIVQSLVCSLADRHLIETR